MGASGWGCRGLWPRHPDNIRQHIIIILHTILFLHATLSQPDHATIFLRCCHIIQEKVMELPFYTKGIGKYWNNKQIVLTRIGLPRKGDPRKRCERPSTTKSCGRTDFVALFIRTDQKAICIVSYPVYYHHPHPAARISESMTSLGFSLESVLLLSFPTLHIRRHVVFFVVFVPVTFKFVPFFVCLGIANVGLTYSWYNLSVGGMKTPEAAMKHFIFYSYCNNLPFEWAT